MNKLININMSNKLRYLIIAFFSISITLSAQSYDWRNVKYSSPIYTNGYCDQPYVVTLPNGKWLCVFTTCEGQEGAKGQHIVSTVSSDQGKSWSTPVRIEEPGLESASWAMPYVTSFGRVYVFYNYNGDKIHSLRDKKNIREDIIGWYCYKYSDDEGKTWSKRYRLDIRKTKVDLKNDWNGDVQIMWGIGKPIKTNDGMMFSFTKIGKYMLFNSEGWIVHSKNIDKEKDVEKLNFKILPEGEEGIKNEEYGPINSEQNIVPLNNGGIYCMHRTISGYPLESYSYDKGKTWSLPQPPKYTTGEPIKHPRACPRIWKCKNGKYLFWHHNNGGKTYLDRNPVWISGGVEKNGRIIWGQPEILFYEDNLKKGMSYPDLIEQDGKYWITETNKENARCHLIPNDFIEALWSQFESPKMTVDDMVFSSENNTVGENDTIIIDKKNKESFNKGITIDLEIEFASIAPKQQLIRLNDSFGKTILLQTGNYGDIEVMMIDGQKVDVWSSDTGVISPYGKHNITVTFDNGPRIIQFIINGKVCDGGSYRQFGWERYKMDLNKFYLNNILTGRLNAYNFEATRGFHNIRIYNRPLLNSEVIGNHLHEGKY